LAITGLTRHQYYYKARTGKRGRRPVVYTKQQVGGRVQNVPNSLVVQQIVDAKTQEDSNYGYRKMTYFLMLKGYYINHKKVYRLMQTTGLLYPRRKPMQKNFVKHRVVAPSGPLEVLAMDIKMVWVNQQRRHAYILTIIDTFTRATLHWQVGMQMKQAQVKQAWEQVIEQHLQPADILSKGLHVELRTDNGPQFSAKMIREFLKLNSIDQVFTHPYTPQENGHVESFHNILAHSLDRYTFWDLEQLENHLVLFYEKYNNERLHGSIAYLWPMLFWEMWDRGLVERKVKANRKVKFTLKIPYQTIAQNRILKEVSCIKSRLLNGGAILNKEAIGPEKLLTTAAKLAPSVVSCTTKLL